jgi:hypothetical protein
MIFTSGKGFIFFFEALLDVECIGVARIAEHLKNLALHRAILRLQEILDLFGRDVADLDPSRRRREIGFVEVICRSKIITGIPPARLLDVRREALKSTAAR